MLTGNHVFEGGSPIILHPPDDAVTAELLHDLDVWMVNYRPDGSADQIGSDALRSEIGNDLRIDKVAVYLEERLLASGRAVLDSQITGDGSMRTVVAVWTLALPAHTATAQT